MVQEASYCTLIAEKFALTSPGILAGQGFSRLLVDTNINSCHLLFTLFNRFIYLFSRFHHCITRRSTSSSPFFFGVGGRLLEESPFYCGATPSWLLNPHQSGQFCIKNFYLNSKRLSLYIQRHKFCPKIKKEKWSPGLSRIGWVATKLYRKSPMET